MGCIHPRVAEQNQVKKLLKNKRSTSQGQQLFYHKMPDQGRIQRGQKEENGLNANCKNSVLLNEGPDASDMLCKDNYFDAFSKRIDRDEIVNYSDIMAIQNQNDDSNEVIHQNTYNGKIWEDHVYQNEQSIILEDKESTLRQLDQEILDLKNNRDFLRQNVKSAQNYGVSSRRKGRMQNGNDVIGDNEDSSIKRPSSKQMEYEDTFLASSADVTSSGIIRKNHQFFNRLSQNIQVRNHNEQLVASQGKKQGGLNKNCTVQIDNSADFQKLTHQTNRKANWLKLQPKFSGHSRNKNQNGENPTSSALASKSKTKLSNGFSFKIFLHNRASTALKRNSGAAIRGPSRDEQASSYVDKKSTFYQSSAWGQERGQSGSNWQRQDQKEMEKGKFLIVQGIKQESRHGQRAVKSEMKMKQIQIKDDNQSQHNSRKHHHIRLKANKSSHTKGLFFVRNQGEALQTDDTLQDLQKTAGLIEEDTTKKEQETTKSENDKQSSQLSNMDMRYLTNSFNLMQQQAVSDCQNNQLEFYPETLDKTFNTTEPRNFLKQKITMELQNNLQIEDQKDSANLNGQFSLLRKQPNESIYQNDQIEKNRQSKKELNASDIVEIISDLKTPEIRKHFQQLGLIFEKKRTTDTRNSITQGVQSAYDVKRRSVSKTQVFQLEDLIQQQVNKSLGSLKISDRVLKKNLTELNIKTQDAAIKNNHLQMPKDHKLLEQQPSVVLQSFSRKSLMDKQIGNQRVARQQDQKLQTEYSDGLIKHAKQQPSTRIPQVRSTANPSSVLRTLSSGNFMKREDSIFGKDNQNECAADHKSKPDIEINDTEKDKIVRNNTNQSATGKKYKIKKGYYQKIRNFSVARQASQETKLANPAGFAIKKVSMVPYIDDDSYLKDGHYVGYQIQNVLKARERAVRHQSYFIQQMKPIH